MGDLEYYKDKARDIKFSYFNGAITYEEAKKELKPCIKVLNDKAKEIAKKYNQKPRLISIQAYLR